MVYRNKTSDDFPARARGASPKKDTDINNLRFVRALQIVDSFVFRTFSCYRPDVRL